MFRKLPIALITLFLFTLGTINAQENNSAFGELSGNTEEGITSLGEYTLEDYSQSVNEYESLLSEYQKAVGDEKERLEEEAVIVARNTLFYKLSVVRDRINAFEADFNQLDFTEEEKQEVSSVTTSFEEYTETIAEDINNLESISGVTNLSGQINTELNNTFEALDPYVVMYSAQKGLDIVVKIESQTELIEEHFSAAVEAGALLDETQEKFSEALSEINDVENRYKLLQAQVGNGAVDDGIRQEVRDLSSKLKINFFAIEDVVQTLQSRHGETPWTLD